MYNLELWKKKKKELNLTLEDISNQTGISISTIKDIFRGATYAPRIDTVQTIEKVLGIQANGLWTDDDYANGVHETKKVEITADEEDVLDKYKEVDQLLGEKGKDLIIDFCDMLIKKLGK